MGIRLKEINRHRSDDKRYNSEGGYVIRSTEWHQDMVQMLK